MFSLKFQRGAFVEVFVPRGRDPVKRWKLSGHVKKVFDKSVRSYVYTVEGGQATKMHLPGDRRQALALKQPWLVLQLKVPSGLLFAVELGATDTSGARHRLMFSTAFKEPHAKALHSQFPLPGLPRSMWTNVCIGVAELLSSHRGGATFSTVDSITIHANCAVRNIFTVRSPPPETVAIGTDDQAGTEPVPPSHDFPFGSPTPTGTIVLGSEAMKRATRAATDRGGESKAAPSSSVQVAFGHRVEATPPRTNKVRRRPGSGPRSSPRPRGPPSARARARARAARQADTSPVKPDPAVSGKPVGRVRERRGGGGGGGASRAQTRARGRSPRAAPSADAVEPLDDARGPRGRRGPGGRAPQQSPAPGSTLQRRRLRVSGKAAVPPPQPPGAGAGAGAGVGGGGGGDDGGELQPWATSPGPSATLHVSGRLVSGASPGIVRGGPRRGVTPPQAPGGSPARYYVDRSAGVTGTLGWAPAAPAPQDAGSEEAALPRNPYDQDHDGHYHHGLTTGYAGEEPTARQPQRREAGVGPTPGPVRVVRASPAMATRPTGTAAGPAPAARSLHPRSSPVMAEVGVGYTPRVAHLPRARPTSAGGRDAVDAAAAVTGTPVGVSATSLVPDTSPMQLDGDGGGASDGDVDTAGAVRHAASPHARPARPSTGASSPGRLAATLPSPSPPPPPPNSPATRYDEGALSFAGHAKSGQSMRRSFEAPVSPVRSVEESAAADMSNTTTDAPDDDDNVGFIIGLAARSIDGFRPGATRTQDPTTSGAAAVAEGEGDYHAGEYSAADYEGGEEDAVEGVEAPGAGPTSPPRPRQPRQQAARASAPLSPPTRHATGTDASPGRDVVATPPRIRAVEQQVVIEDVVADEEPDTGEGAFGAVGRDDVEVYSPTSFHDGDSGDDDDGDAMVRLRSPVVADEPGGFDGDGESDDDYNSGGEQEDADLRRHLAFDDRESRHAPGRMDGRRYEDADRDGYDDYDEAHRRSSSRDHGGDVYADSGDVPQPTYDAYDEPLRSPMHSLARRPATSSSSRRGRGAEPGLPPVARSVGYDRSEAVGTFGIRSPPGEPKEVPATDDTQPASRATVEAASAPSARPDSPEMSVVQRLTRELKAKQRRLAAMEARYAAQFERLGLSTAFDSPAAGASSGDLAHEKTTEAVPSGTRSDIEPETVPRHDTSDLSRPSQSARAEDRSFGFDFSLGQSSPINLSEDLGEESMVLLATQKFSGPMGHVRAASGDVAGPDMVEMIYDPTLACYFDPKTNKYYEASAAGPMT